jgi:ankyrin repeat protein
MSQQFYDKAELLIDHGADLRPIHRRKKHITLVNATRSMKCTLIAKMLNRGFDVNEKSDAGETPLSVAVTDGKVEVAELLLCHGADPNMRIGPFSSVLSLVIAKGHVEVADALRKHGAKEKARKWMWMTKTIWSVWSNCCRLRDVPLHHRFVLPLLV